jgi:hypothetical protein
VSAWLRRKAQEAVYEPAEPRHTPFVLTGQELVTLIMLASTLEPATFTQIGTQALIMRCKAAVEANRVRVTVNWD